MFLYRLEYDGHSLIYNPLGVYLFNKSETRIIHLTFFIYKNNNKDTKATSIRRIAARLFYLQYYLKFKV